MHHDHMNFSVCYWLCSGVPQPNCASNMGVALVVTLSYKEVLPDMLNAKTVVCFMEPSVSTSHSMLTLTNVIYGISVQV